MSPRHGGRARGLPHQHRVRLDDIEYATCQEAARLYNVPLGLWMRRVLTFEAGRARMAASNTPQGLHPNAQVWRVTDAPAQGAWAYRPYFVSTGIERIFVTSMLEDAPESISPDHHACVIDVVNGAKNLVVRLKNVRWVGISPLEDRTFAAKAREDERKEASA